MLPASRPRPSTNFFSFIPMFLLCPVGMLGHAIFGLMLFDEKAGEKDAIFTRSLMLASSSTKL